MTHSEDSHVRAMMETIMHAHDTSDELDPGTHRIRLVGFTITRNGRNKDVHFPKPRHVSSRQALQNLVRFFTGTTLADHQRHGRIDLNGRMDGPPRRRTR